MDPEVLMQQRRFSEAITALEARLAEDERDLGALLRLGICHLLNRSETVFLTIYHRAAQLAEELGRLPEPVSRLWAQYQALFVRMTASALFLGTVGGLAACDDLTSSHRYSGGVYLEEGAAEGEGEGTDGGGADATSAHRYSGGVYLDGGTEGEEEAASGHRYSGGVYLDASAD